VPVLLIVHHTTSPSLHSLFDSVMTGAEAGAREAAADPATPVGIVARPALAATAVDVLEADAYILGTPANLGYMSGALKHFFDQIYYPCLEATARRPYACYIHGNNDTAGALRSIQTVTTGLRWDLAQAPLEVIGAPTKTDLEAAWELGAAMSARLTLDPA
jgi:NAD(P)H-dependent FMN reductase